jgi:hypothetical protein
MQPLDLEKVQADGCSGGFEGMCGKQFYITETWF